jgi:hypothetical protein
MREAYGGGRQLFAHDPQVNKVPSVLYGFSKGISPPNLTTYFFLVQKYLVKSLSSYHSILKLVFRSWKNGSVAKSAIIGAYSNSSDWLSLC